MVYWCGCLQMLSKFHMIHIQNYPNYPSDDLMDAVPVNTSSRLFKIRSPSPSMAMTTAIGKCHC